MNREEKTSDFERSPIVNVTHKIEKVRLPDNTPPKIFLLLFGYDNPNTKFFFVDTHRHP